MDTPFKARQHDHSRDSLRRALREADAAQREAMPQFREALRRLFHPESPDRHVLTVDAKAELLGVPAPARRHFLRTGGLAVFGAVAVAACSDDGGSSADGEGTTVVSPSPGDIAGPLRPTNNDILLAAVSVQIENAAMATYDAVLAARSAELRSIGLADSAVVFRDHHAEHAGALNGLLTDNGRDEVPADVLFDRIVVPTADELGAMPVAEVVALVRGLENQAAQTYITSIPLMSVPELRRTLLSIGAIEAKHVTAIDMIVEQGLGGYGSTAELIVGGNYPTNESFLAR